MLISKIKEYAMLMRLDKPIGILLLLWPTLWALWIAAEGLPDISVFVVFMAGVFLMRSAGCVINDYADRKIDPLVARTKNRPIAAGRVQAKEALWLFGGMILLAGGLVLQLNTFTLQLSLVAIFLAVIYPFTKRVTHLPQFVLGLAFAWAIPMAFAAQINYLPFVVWPLMAANIFWTAGYDTIYAMVDREDDQRIGVKSTAILFAKYDKWMIGLFQVVALLLLIWIGILEAMTLSYWLGLCAAAGFSVYQQILIQTRKPEQCFRAFLNNNWFGCSVFVGIASHYVLID